MASRPATNCLSETELDTKPLELEAELHIRSRLIAAGFNVAKPDFDSLGADLLLIERPGSVFTRLLKVQCKGRSVGKGTNIRVATEYVTENFILFAYLTEGLGRAELYMFDHEQIKQWKVLGNEFSLNIPQDAVTKRHFDQYKFNEVTSSIRIRLLLSKVLIKRYSAVIADEAFIQRAIDIGLHIYGKIYPGRAFRRPSTVDVVRGILSIYRIDTDPGLPIRCHLFTNRHDQNSSSVDRIVFKDDQVAKIYWERSDGPVSVDLMEYLERVVNVENIMMVADDFCYEPRLRWLKEQGVDIKIIQLSSHDGRQIYTNHQWGDVIYAVAHSMNLSRLEW